MGFKADQLQGYLDVAVRERDEACERLARAHGQKCCCKKWRATVDARVIERDQARQERDDLALTVSSSRAEVDEVRARLDGVRDQRDKAEAVLKTLADERDKAIEEADAYRQEAETRKVTQVRQALRIGKHEEELHKLCTEIDALRAKLRLATARDDWPGTLRQIADHLDGGATCRRADDHEPHGGDGVRCDGTGWG